MGNEGATVGEQRRRRRQMVRPTLENEMTHHTQPADDLDIADLKSRINPAYANTKGTESYERRLCVERIEQQAKRIEELEAERESFYMDYRRKCDEETKRLEAKLAAIKNAAMEPEMWMYPKGQGFVLCFNKREDMQLGTPIYTAAQLAKLQAERNEAKAELLALHEILMCPGECPPVAEGDTLTVRLLKGYVAAVDKLVEDQAAQIARAREALEWYADGNHIRDLPDHEPNTRENRERLSDNNYRHVAEKSNGDDVFVEVGVKAAEALSTPTTGNAVQAIEARALPDNEVRYWLCCGSRDPEHRDKCYEAERGHPERVRYGTAQEHSDWAHS